MDESETSTANIINCDTKQKRIFSNENCCVYGCKSVRKKNSNLMYHCFPKTGQIILTENGFGHFEIQDRRKLWENELKMGKTVTKSMKVCSLHFSQDDYECSGWSSLKRLKPTAVPNQNLPVSQLPKRIESRRIARKKHQNKLQNTNLHEVLSRKVPQLEEQFEVIYLQSYSDAVDGFLLLNQTSEDACVQTIKMESRKGPQDIYRCDFCSYATKSFFNILDHERRHQRKLQGHSNLFKCSNNIHEIYKCENCNFETNLKVSLIQHFNQSHKDPLKDKNQFRNVMRQCEYCDFQTYSLFLLLKHCLKCGNSEKFGEGSKIVTWLECAQCSYKTKCKYNLKKHNANIHTNSANVVWHYCNKCGHKTKLKCNLNKHISNVHTDPSNIVWHHCNKCEYKAKRKSNLKQHLTDVHTDSVKIMWHHCNKCEYKAKRKSSLKQHIGIVHRDPSNIIVWNHCNKCEYKTKWKQSLKKHMIKIHCDQDEYVSKMKANLRKHITNVERDSAWNHCNKCEYKSKWKKDLKKHEANVHTDSANIVWH